MSNLYRKKIKRGSRNDLRYREWYDRFEASENQKYAEPRLAALMGEAIVLDECGETESVRYMRPVVWRRDPAPQETSEP